MKGMKMLLLLVCGVGIFAICFNVMGQQQRTPAAPQDEWEEVQTPGQSKQMSTAERNKKIIETRLSQLDKYLKLTPTQKKKIKTIMEKNQPSMNKIEEQIRQLQEQKRKIKESIDEEIKLVLTAEQINKYEILQKVLQENQSGPGGRPGGPGGGPGGPGGEGGGPGGPIKM